MDPRRREPAKGGPAGQGRRSVLGKRRGAQCGGLGHTDGAERLAKDRRQYAVEGHGVQLRNGERGAGNQEALKDG